MRGGSKAVPTPKRGIVDKNLHNEAQEPEDCHSAQQCPTQIRFLQQLLRIQETEKPQGSKQEGDKETMDQEHLSIQKGQPAQFILPPKQPRKNGVRCRQTEQENSRDLNRRLQYHGSPP